MTEFADRNGMVIRLDDEVRITGRVKTIHPNCVEIVADDHKSLVLVDHAGVEALPQWPNTPGGGGGTAT